MNVARRTGAAAVLAFLAASGTATAQNSPFTPDDMLKIASISVLDMTEDRRSVAAAVRRPIENPTTDHRRFGDPTYLAPSLVTLRIVDSRSGQMEQPFKDLVNVRDTAWSRDGKTLAILLARDATAAGGYPTTEIAIWNTAARALTRLKLQDSQTIALNSTLSWTPDGTGLVVALRSPELDRDARAKFTTLTEGPVVVHSSTEPFLEWDALQRSTRSRAIAIINVRDGSVRTVLPQGRVTSYQTSRDGSFMTVMEDVTSKTDYDVIGGTEHVLKHVDITSGETRVVMPAKDLKGITLRWTDDGRTYAYAKKGEVFVQSVDGAPARSLTPKPKPDAKDAKEEPPAPPGDAEKPAEESFTPVSFSRNGARLLVTSRKGWYVVNVADGVRDLIVPMAEDEEANPRLSAIAWAPDGSRIYATWAARDQWQRGIVRIDLATKTMAPVVRDSRLYSGAQLS